MKRVLIIGGSSGVGLALAQYMAETIECEHVYVVDKKSFPIAYKHKKITFQAVDLSIFDYSFLSQYQDIDGLIITAGFGHLGLFQDFDETYIRRIFDVNAIAPICILRHFYPQLLAKTTFCCAVLVSIAGRLNSPLFSLYSATKAAVSKCIEAVNVELEKSGSKNRILEVSPGSLKGTSFYGGETQPELLRPLVEEIVSHMQQSDLLYIPQYDEIYARVLDRYSQNAHDFGLESYDYKMSQNR